MNRSLFLVSALLCFSGLTVGQSLSKVFQALAGDTVILPCSTTDSGDLPTVEWSKGGRMEHITFLYRDGCEIHEMKNPSFRYRTSLIMNELKNGNISLRISNVQLSDAGKHICKKIRNKAIEQDWVELSVGAVSEPKLSVVPVSGGGVTLQCEANCWYPKPEITFEDEKGNSIDAEIPNIEKDSRGCFNVTRRLNVQTGISRIFCRVHQPEIKQMKLQEIYIPADCFSSCATSITMASVEAAVLLLLPVILLLRCICKKFGICVRFQEWQSSRKGIKSESADESLLLNAQTENAENATKELLKKIDELELNPDEKSEIIRRLTEELPKLMSKQSADENQNDKPATDNSLFRSPSDVTEPINSPSSAFPKKPKSPKPAASTNSKPLKSGSLPRSKDPVQNPAPDPKTESKQTSSLAEPLLLNASPSSAVTSGKSLVSRSSSFSGSWSPPTSAKPQRRHTTLSWSENPFSPLENLSEDGD